MRLSRYITAILAIFIAASCTIDTTDDLPIVSGGGSDCQFKFEARATRFDDYNVTTRANKTAEEAYVSSMALVVFPVEDGKIQPCISYARLSGDNLTFTIDRKQLRESLKAAGQDEDKYDGVPFALYVFANMDLPATFGDLSDEQKKLDWYLKEYYHQNTNGIRRPQNGFPMYGSLGDFVTPGADGKKFILMPKVGAGKADVLPTVDGTPSDYIPIPMTALYAKHSFSIRIEPDQELNEGIIPMFTMTGYKVYNIPAGAEIDWSADSKNMEENGSEVLSNEASVVVNGQAISNATIDFEFYLPERLLDPATSAEKFKYPFGKDGSTVEGYNNVREEDKRYCQRYKKQLLGDNQKATYIVISGQFRNHQGHTYDVDYTIYLGADNYGDFNIKRNAHYINKIVLRGITASSDQSVNQDGFFVDHRVNVERSLPIIVNLQRETKLDSHFEVRPLRIRYPLADGESLPAGAKVTVEVEAKTKTDDAKWVRLEHKNSAEEGDATYCTNGKRRYFTTNLVTFTLQDTGSKIEITLNGAKQETVWIYIDQCDYYDGQTVGEVTYDDSRQAIISVTYEDASGKQEPHKYTLNQYTLYPVKTTRLPSDVQGSATASGDFTYYIEHEEEYLYNFDSDDNYGQTEQAGMKWGLEDIQLSSIGDAFYLSHSVGGAWTDVIGDYSTRTSQAFNTLSPKPKYDFYLIRDIRYIMGEHFDTQLLKPETNKYGDILNIHNFDGYKLNTIIRDYILSNYRDNEKAKIEAIALDEKPKSAFAYCYNKNKRNKEGIVETIEWYLPAIDEIEDIAENAYGDFGTVFQGNLYWSCQPAYDYITVALQRYRYPLFSWQKVEGNIFYGGYFADDVDRARATRVKLSEGKYEETISSGSEVSDTRTGNIYISLTRKKDTELDDPILVNAMPYQNHKGNLSRSDYARVRCVRKMD